MKVIAVSGHARHGKDTVAEMLRDELSNNGYRVLVTHYADLLKYICKTFFGWDGKKDEAGRTLLQRIGTDVIRNENPNFWVDFIADILCYFNEYWDFVIIPDTRFPNELNRLAERGFDVTHIWVERPGFDNGLSEEQRNHPSETALDNTKADFYIVNDGDLRSLRNITNLITEELYANRQ